MLRHRTRSYPGLRTYVFSRTLRAADYPEVTVLGDNGLATVAELRAAGGKDIWLCGGGDLFRSLLDANLVDAIELGVSPQRVEGRRCRSVGRPRLAGYPMRQAAVVLYVE